VAKQFLPPPVLVVEDSAEVRRSLEWLLRGHGYAVVTAVHGADALRKLHAGLRPCLILLDLQMPEMDGFEFRQRQLQDPQLASIPVVVCSAIGDPDAAARQLKAEAYVQKPVELDALLAVVAAHCRKPVKAPPPELKRAS
jgi:CheY-like chemotaxis protein